VARDEQINLDLAQVKDALTRGLAAADPARAEGLATLLGLTEARDAGLVREQQRLSRLLPADDPRIVALASKLQTSRDLSARVSFEARRSDAGLEKVDPKVWTLQGFVFLKDESWLKDKAVALFDANGAIIAGSETSLDGSKFVIRYLVPPSDITGKVVTTSPVLVGLIAIGGRQRLPVFVDPRPLVPQNGRLTYVEINIGVPPQDAPKSTPPSNPDPSRPTPPSNPDPSQPNPPTKTDPTRPGPTPPGPVDPRRPTARPGTGPADSGAATHRRAASRRRPAGGKERSD